MTLIVLYCKKVYVVQLKVAKRVWDRRGQKQWFGVLGLN